MYPLFGDLLTGPALFVALLSALFVLVPGYYLLMALRERGVFERLR